MDSVLGGWRGDKPTTTTKKRFQYKGTVEPELGDQHSSEAFCFPSCIFSQFVLRAAV